MQEKALPAMSLALEKTPGLGSKIDLVLTLIRMGFFFEDQQLIKENLEKAEEYVIRSHACPSKLTRFRLIEQGGDWDRRNRLKVYQALHLLSIR